MSTRNDNSPARSTVDGIAIVGMAGRFPGAESIDAYWANLLAGTDSITRFRADQLDASIPADLRNHPRYVPARGVLANADRFDAAFFGIPAREALLMDPQQRVFLELCWNALEHAGVDPERYAGSIGVYAGTSNNSYRKLVDSRPDLVESSGEFAAMVANEKDYVATRVAHRIGLNGPALSIHTACSTSLVAIAQAWYALMSWQCDIALAGGINIVVPQESGYLPVEGGMESSDGVCRPFDADANGTLFSSGGAVVALKRASDAIADGDMIFAIIRGVGVNNDGADKASFSAPSVRGQAAAIRIALSSAGTPPHSIGYVEAHGTGTALGDPIEVEALTRAFREDTDASQFCWLGSAKSNFGHLVAASGVAGLIKSALALHHGKIPATLHFDRANPEIDFAATPFKVADHAIDWPRSAQPRRAGVSSFGVGGTNAHVILEEAPLRTPASSGRAVVVLPLSARDDEALQRRATELADALADFSDTDLPDIGYTLALGRKPLGVRGCVVASSIADARNALARVDAMSAMGNPRIVFGFPGQGSQHANMASGLIDSEVVYREAFDEVCALATPLLGRGLRTLILPAAGDEVAGDEAGADAALADTRFTQPALFAVEFALAKLWQSYGLEPAAMIGHSIGEYVAATLAGVFSLADAVRLVVARATAMADQPTGAMLAVRASEADVAARLNAEVEIATLNAPELTVVSGSTDAIDAFAKSLDAAGIANTHLRVSHAFHSRLMDGALDTFRAAFTGIRLNAPTLPFYSCVSGKLISDADAISPEYWCKQIRAPVRFVDAARNALSEPDTIFLEVGPGQVLTGLARSLPNGRERAVASLGPSGKPDDDATHFATALGECWKRGVTPAWNKLFGTSRRKCALPGYPFRGERYWIESVAAAPMSVAAKTTEARVVAATSTGGSVAKDAEPTSTPPRIDRLARELSQLFENLSGETIGAAQANTSFLDLGLDSLSLTQAALELERRFGLKLRFRRLLEDLDCVAKLAALVNATMPAESAEIVVSTKSAVPFASATPSSENDELQPANLVERPFGASARIVTQRKTGFTPAQQEWVADFIKRYNARTAKSKAFSQEHRRRMADPRVVTGFNPLWKELVYPIVVERSKGARMHDIDGNEYIDVLNSFGANYLGYQPDYIVAAVKQQLDEGMEIGPQHPLTAEVAELISSMTGMPRVAFCNTGSEAVMGAMRIARTVTGRSTIVIFTNSYHGIFDEVIVRGTRQLRSIAAAPGILASAVENVLVLEYGSEESLRVIRERAHELAAVMIEPVQGKNPVLQPREFVQSLREICDAGGCALIFDEVITGFRIAPGGAQEFYDVRADIATYGKVIGGGMPIAAIAGRERWLDALDGGDWQFGDDSYPEAGVTYFAGTFVRHPLALAAAKAALTHLRECGPELQRGLNRRSADLVVRLNRYFKQHSAPLKAVGFSSLWRIVVDDDQPFASLFWYALRERGLHVYEQFNCFLTEAHGDAEAAAIAERVEQVVGEMLDAGMLSARAQTSIPAVLPATVPLTDAQLDKWLACQFSDQASTAFNESILLHLDGPLDVSAFKRAFADIVQRHEAFALTFATDGSSQCVTCPDPLALTEVDFGDVDVQQRIADHCHALMSAPFDLSQAPLARAQLLRLGSDKHVLLLVAHHLIFDGWSAAVLLDELQRGYAAHKNGTAAANLPAAESFRAYVLAERARRTGDDAARQIDYWKHAYATLPPALMLPSDRPAPIQPLLGANSLRHEFPPEVVAGLRSQARALGVTLYSLLLSTFSVLLARLSGQGDFAVGIPFAGQAIAGSGHLIGDGVGMLPLRMSVDTQATLTVLAKATHRTLLDAADHQDLTLNTLIRAGVLPRNSGQPLVKVIFNLNPKVPALTFPGLTCELRDCAKTALFWDMFFNLNDRGDTVTLDLHYSTALFDAATMQRWTDQYQRLLATIAGDATLSLSDLATRSGIAEPARSSLSGPTFAVDSNANVFALIAANTEHANAGSVIRCGDSQCALTELLARSEALARTLVARGVERGERVGICLPRGIEALTGVLAIMRCAAAYVPLDPNHPVPRLRHVVEQSGMRRIIATGPNAIADAVAKGCEVLAFDALQADHTNGDLPEVRGDDLAYVLFTSGSTGVPKGVRVLQRNLVNFLRAMQQQPGLASNDVLCAVTTLSFDIAGLELYLPLVCAADLVIASESEVNDPQALAGLIRTRKVSVLQTTPSLLRALIDAGSDGAIAGLKLLVGGEALPRDLANRALDEARELWNMYGPTETTIWSACQRIERGDGPVPLGKPIANTRIDIVDGDDRPVPLGAQGEILISGSGVADGYIGAAHLTEQRFPPDRLGSDGTHSYRTGDIGSLRDGVLYFHGRSDDQIKIRGHRVELGDIEAAALADDNVREAAASLLVLSPSDTRIVLHVRVDGDGANTVASLRESLRARLPAYMLPQHIDSIAELPKTANGKLDRAALPRPQSLVASSSNAEAAATSVPKRAAATSVFSDPREQFLADLWQELIGSDDVRSGDNFFEVGGHSLLAVEMATRVQQATGVRINLLMIATGTLASLAAGLPKRTVAKQVGSAPIVPSADSSLFGRVAKLIGFRGGRGQ
ncbi:MAG: amino acid adenylation domain-containing protein [Dokdonella sp.]